ncbi:hypothetical protein I79_006217 [Cricetulus griseus]|uniref:Uncharacterized protein n=1 Tax=Cricetulus griseus TaxID=10029 RepID=G3H788_CRIGR|nr:hypothetical protein I79_006217 [Cricetulus griseus]
MAEVCLPPALRAVLTALVYAATKEHAACLEMWSLPLPAAHAHHSVVSRVS